ncbi:MAG: hypothetical protein NC548_11255 [Lachnospiraceae bacterium]|nr:hypothetical protein [Lachnospiraceae bacterium]MCM1235613.1 hypothetical protein [Ruminococcus flavefaciens]
MKVTFYDYDAEKYRVHVINKKHILLQENAATEVDEEDIVLMDGDEQSEYLYGSDIVDEGVPKGCKFLTLCIDDEDDTVDEVWRFLRNTSITCAILGRAVEDIPADIVSNCFVVKELSK